MSIKKLLCAAGALAFAACSEPTEPRTADADSQKVDALLWPGVQPDLVVASLAHSPTSPDSRDVITFAAVVQNIGLGAAGPSTLEFRIGGETPGSPATRFAIPSLISGQKFVVKRQMTLIAQNYRNTATADVNNNVPETNEANNLRTDDYTVTLAERIAFTRNQGGNWEIYAMKPDGTGVTQLTYNPTDDYAPAWKPGGSKIAFVRWGNGNNQIYVMNYPPDGTAATPLTYGADPAWSPDGSKIAFTSANYSVDSQGEIYVMNADGTGVPTRLTYTSGYDGEPAWSPDGTKIAFTSFRDGDYRVYVMNATDGSGVTRRTSITSFLPAWKPDGSKIAFSSGDDLTSEIYLMNPDGTGVSRLMSGFADLAWSRGGSKIAYVNHCYSSDCEVYVANADGSGAVNRSNNQVYDGQPDWALMRP